MIIKEPISPTMNDCVVVMQINCELCLWSYDSALENMFYAIMLFSSAFFKLHIKQTLLAMKGAKQIYACC